MNLVYRLVLFLISGVLHLLKPFSVKLNHFLVSRKSLFKELEIFRNSYSGPVTWFHVSSLGEYEQALPVIASLKSKKSELAIVVSFFSPSGYDHVVKKPNSNVDFISYLPIDRKSLAEKFVEILNPDLAIFVKYDLWFHHIQALKKRQIPVFLIAASLREDQSFFGIFGSFFSQNLFAMDWIFTQNEKSLSLLKTLKFNNASLAGDTRFDRVASTAASPRPLPEIKDWIAERPVIVIGSAWDDDMKILIPLINSRPNYCWIIAPHDLNPESMDRWTSQIQLHSQRYSSWSSTDSNSVLFIDNIGMLSSLYQFAKVAYVGGAFGKGLHNILEPMGYGIPVIFGKVKNPSKFPEAAQSELEGCGFSVSTEESLAEKFASLENADFYQKAVYSTQIWVKSNLGAAERIVEKISQLSSKI